MAPTGPMTRDDEQANPDTGRLTGAELAALQREVAELEAELALRRALLQTPIQHPRSGPRRLDCPLPIAAPTRGSREEA